MVRNWLKDMGKYAVWSGALLLATAGAGRAQQVAPVAQDEVQAKLQAQQREIDELKQLIRSGATQPTAAPTEAGATADGSAAKTLTDKDVQDIIKSYLNDHPGAGMPASVQTGFENGKGFVIRSVDDPAYVKWDDQSKIPFELRIRGRAQLDYYSYKVTDTVNHLTGVRSSTGTATGSDFSAFEVKRLRLIFEGTAFDPNLRYHFELDGNTRGLNTLDTRQNAFANPEGNIVGGQAISSVDAGVRLFQAWVAYDWHPCTTEKGCGPDCPDGTYKYSPTITGVVGKMKPLFGLEEYLGSGNQQFVEYSMADWFFDADGDNMLTGIAAQVKALDDRFFGMLFITNGNDNQLPVSVLDNMPGINAGFWYDFGGTWNAKKNAYDLFGDSLSDIDYSCNPVARVGGAVDLTPMGRRTNYTTAELDYERVGGGSNGGTLTSVLNGAGVAPGALPGIAPAATLTTLSPFGVDAFDAYRYDVWAAAKYHGFSIYNEWWLRNIDNFRGTEVSGAGSTRPILYTANNAAGATSVALFPKGIGLVDYGTTIQAGYFVIPKKLELACRWSWIRGQSADINGNHTGSSNLSAADVAKLGIPAGTTVAVVNGAFRNYSESQEFAVGVNYFFKRQNVKWSTDLSFYNGGNPGANGQSPAGFIPGVDGWMVRTQLQFGF